MTEQYKVPQTLEEFRGSEQVVDPPVKTVLPSIEPENWPSYGENCLAIFPTTNKDKIEPFKKHFTNSGGTWRFVNFKVPDHGVSQPYNEEGPKAAQRRTKDAKILFKENYPKYRQLNRIGPTYIATIESAFQMHGFVRPVDYATISITNVLTGNVVTAISKGVTLNLWFVEKARSHGFINDDEDCGVKTAGAIVAETIEGVHPQKWHKEAAGIERVDILDDGVKDMPLP
ncbi:Non-canonical purine NTP phosphatase/PRRC1 [Fusarium oxysporum f. sp. vasinfectum]|uniref:Uncharacterized protein n=1 Tax=Fusarium oxysporum f. sp. vasinfectum 25433 TaxID=1089449 RepID=X0KX06_FUSOX|nr:hypothetical protein FOTG_18327 [Fusarium oxysporum f. sp. vasinfectum 25433]KAH7461587.1 hypothetical protein FOMA001_g19024 [Fusarium oxysporum f. sp. matthiolae]KAK2666790.1 Non-canonical purine NTP phosphatase/PRRC1 [Fusarium oxysporum f. sp. vasinfectum]KAK2922879.1 Non-canonical purine NTP phosphatase/PRRC1 [Fusarium oxysporum f. sp. vasinfectum]